MFRNSKRTTNPPMGLALLICFVALAWTVGVYGVWQRPRRVFTTPPAESEGPLFSEYRGVRLGMTADEVRAKLGEPELITDEQDYYVFSDHEAARVGYDSDLRVRAISVDYIGEDAPEYRTIVRGEPERAADGSLYKLEIYEDLGVWVSYSRSDQNLTFVNVTLEKIQ